MATKYKRHTCYYCGRKLIEPKMELLPFLRSYKKNLGSVLTTAVILTL